MAAAVAAAETGAQVLLVEEEYELGGHLRWGDEADLAFLRGLREEVAGTPGIEVMTNSVVNGRYDDNWVAVMQRDLPHVDERLVKARARTLVVAPGLIERPYVFKGNDTPGVILSTAARRLIKLHAVKPGERAVVFSANESGDAAAEDLRRSGVEVARVVDARKGGDIVRVRSGKGVHTVECADGEKIECDLLVTAIGWTAPTSLLNMAGDRPVYNEKTARFFSSTSPTTCWRVAASPVTGRSMSCSPTRAPQAARPPGGPRRPRGGWAPASRRPPTHEKKRRRQSTSRSCLSTSIRRCSVGRRTASWITPRTSPPRTSSRPRKRATTP